MDSVARVDDNINFDMHIINVEMVTNILVKGGDRDSYYRRIEGTDDIAWEENSCSEWMGVCHAVWLEAMYQDVLRHNPKPLKQYD